LKLLRRISAFFINSRISSLFIMAVAVFALFSFIMTAAWISDQYYNYSILKNSKVKNGYIFGTSLYEFIIQQGNTEVQRRFKENEDLLRNNPLIKDVYTIKVANHAEYGGGPLSIVLYDKELLDAFPLLRRYGIDFSSDSNGVIVSGELFREMKAGDSIDVVLTNGSQKTPTSLTVAGHMNYPYKFLSFNSVTTELSADDLFSNIPVMIMQANEKVFPLLENNTRIAYNPDILFTFKEEATDEQIENTLTELRKIGVVGSIERVIAKSKENVLLNVKTFLTRPLFLMIATLIAYLSVVIVMVFKKRKEIAIEYLCGASKKDILLTLFGACLVISIVPAVIITIFVLVAPELQWKGYYKLSGQLITTDLLWIVAAYFVLTVIVSQAAVLVSIGRKTPLGYLRGLE